MHLELPLIVRASHYSNDWLKDSPFLGAESEKNRKHQQVFDEVFATFPLVPCAALAGSRLLQESLSQDR